MGMSGAGKATLPWWRTWLTELTALVAASDYTTTDYLLDRIARLEGRVQDMRAELDSRKADGR